MNQQNFSKQLDRIIHDVLEQRRQGKLIRVILTGDDGSTLADTFRCMEALYRAGYGLAVTFSHTASLSAIKSICVRWKEEKGIDILFDACISMRDNDDYHGVFLPRLSTNSMAKIALCLQDNVASQSAFYALSRNKPVIATLNEECQSLSQIPTLFLRRRLMSYIDTLEQYGVVFSGAKPSKNLCNQTVITLGEIRRHCENKFMLIDRSAVITPAAQDEIRRLNITVEHVN